MQLCLLKLYLCFILGVEPSKDSVIDLLSTLMFKEAPSKMAKDEYVYQHLNMDDIKQLLKKYHPEAENKFSMEELNKSASKVASLGTMIRESSSPRVRPLYVLQGSAAGK